MRTFTLKDGTSDKFWSVDVNGPSVTVNYGRVGTAGQTKTNVHADAATADAEAAKLIASKVKKGYTESAAAGGSLTPVPVTAKAAAPTPAPAAPTPPPAAEPIITQPGDLGLLLTRSEEAALRWGRPLDTYTPSTAPFSAAKAADWAKANAVKSDPDYARGLQFPVPPFDGVPSEQEAQWWSAWVKLGLAPFAPAATRAKAVSRLLDGTLEEVTWRLDEGWYTDDPFIAIAAELGTSTPWDVAQRHLVPRQPAAGRSAGGTALEWSTELSRRAANLPVAQALLLPQLTDEMRSELAALDPGKQSPLGDVLWAVQGGDPAELAAVIDNAPADLFIDTRGSGLGAWRTYLWTETLAVLAAAPDQETAVGWWRRFGHDVQRHNSCELRYDQFGLLLGILGAAVLPDLGDYIASRTNSGHALAQIAGLAQRLHGPAAAGFFARLARDSRGPATARDWLLEHPVALWGGTYVAKDASVLESVVRQLAETDAGVLQQSVTDPVLSSVLSRLQELDEMPLLAAGSEPSWWVDAVAAEAAAPLPPAPDKGGLAVPTAAPDFAKATSLPPVVLDGARLDPDLVDAVIRSAVAGANDPTLTARPLVSAVREQLEQSARDTLATGLFHNWIAAGAPPTGRAYFLAAGFIGSDGFVLTILPLVREWPGQSQHQRAVLGLKVLAATGSRSALQGISGIANKSKFKAIQEAARQSLITLAALQGLSSDQLEDQVVPDGDLDARGVRVLSFGPRSFRISLSPQGKAVIRDLDADGKPVGKPRTALPAPNSKDDADLAAAAKAEFTVLRKQLTEVAKIQTARLEKAMVSGRTWTLEEHRTHLVGNPVLSSLIRPLIWIIRDGDQRTLVRVSEENEYLTLDENALDATDGATVALAHPLQLTADEISAWQEHLTDYDLLPPIQQLDRPTFALPAGTTTELPAAALPQGVINPGGLVSTLERMGWRRSAPADGGVVRHLWLAFPAQDRAVIISISDGLWTGMITESGDQRITAAHVTTPAIAKDTWYFDPKKNALPWSDLNPVAVSEALRGLAAVAEKMT